MVSRRYLRSVVAVAMSVVKGVLFSNITSINMAGLFLNGFELRLWLGLGFALSFNGGLGRVCVLVIVVIGARSRRGREADALVLAVVFAEDGLLDLDLMLGDLSCVSHPERPTQEEDA